MSRNSCYSKLVTYLYNLRISILCYLAEFIALITGRLLRKLYRKADRFNIHIKKGGKTHDN